MPWRQRIFLILLLLLAALAILWAFLPGPVPVETAKVSRGPLRVTVEEEGKARLRDRFVVSAPVAGYARRVDLEVGDPVKRGQVVAEIEPLRAEGLDPRARAAAQARVSAAEAALRAAEERVREAAAADEYASARLERTRRLTDAELMPKDTLEQAASEAHRASAVTRSAEAATDAARHELEGAKAALTRAGASDGRHAGRVHGPVPGDREGAGGPTRKRRGGPGGDAAAGGRRPRPSGSGGGRPLRGRRADPPRDPGPLRTVGRRSEAGGDSARGGARGVHEGVRPRGGGAAGLRARRHHLPAGRVEGGRRPGTGSRRASSSGRRRRCCRCRRARSSGPGTGSPSTSWRRGARRRGRWRSADGTGSPPSCSRDWRKGRR